MHIKILGSECAKSDYYFEMVNKVAQDLQLDFTIQKIVDEDALKEYGVTKVCTLGYCPGCNFLMKESDESRNTPALVINDEVKLHSCFPEEEKIKELLLESAT